MCEQGTRVRVQVEKSKPKDDIKNPNYEESNIKPRCKTTTSKISDNRQTTTQINPSVPSYPLSDRINPMPMIIDQMQSYETEWHCEICDYSENLSTSERCVYCQEGHRPSHIKSSSTRPDKRPDRIHTDDRRNKPGNLLFQSAFSKEKYFAFLKYLESSTKLHQILNEKNPNESIIEYQQSTRNTASSWY